MTLSISSTRGYYYTIRLSLHSEKVWELWKSMGTMKTPSSIPLQALTDSHPEKLPLPFVPLLQRRALHHLQLWQHDGQHALAHVDGDVDLLRATCRPLPHVSHVWEAHDRGDQHEPREARAQHGLAVAPLAVPHSGRLREERGRERERERERESVRHATVVTALWDGTGQTGIIHIYLFWQVWLNTIACLFLSISLVVSLSFEFLSCSHSVTGAKLFRCSFMYPLYWACMSCDAFRSTNFFNRRYYKPLIVGGL